jgi:asparagine synthase (glutamine-hydrolysing)
VCGLVASATIGSERINDNFFLNLLSIIAHRGPDGYGVEKYFSESLNFDLHLGHNRLSIIDLSEGGRQPMSDVSGRFKIIFNGEIYNYSEIRSLLESQGVRFRTDSDTEVLLYTWITLGETGLTQLIGMFSFLIFDSAENKIHCVRDAFGIKPLFFFLGNQEFYCSSEAAPILAALKGRATLNYQSVYDYLVNDDYDRHSHTFFSQIENVLPGSILTVEIINFEFVKSVTHWHALHELRNNLPTYESSVSHTRELLLSSVKYHMRSDVEVGAALSGGIDSSAIACAMKHLVPDIKFHTFSYVSENIEFNEERWIDLVNKHIDAIPHKVKVNSDSFFHDVVDLIKFQGAPFGSTSIYAQFKVFEEARRNGIKVVLEGQGADEIFAGYDGYLGERFISLVEQQRYIESLNFLRAWLAVPGRTLFGAILLIVKQIIPPSLYTFGLRILGRNNSPKWLNVAEFIKRSTSLTAWKLVPNVNFRGRRVKEKLLSQIRNKHLPSLLRHGDRNSMANSVENRVPFLTLQISEYILSLPEDYLVSNNGITKGLLRDAMRGIVPNDILDRKDKIGFGTPTLTHSADLWKNFRNDFLSNAPKNIFDLSALEIYMDMATQGKDELNWQPWRILNFIIWHKVVFERKDFNFNAI